VRLRREVPVMVAVLSTPPVTVTPLGRFPAMSIVGLGPPVAVTVKLNDFSDTLSVDGLVIGGAEVTDAAETIMICCACGAGTNAAAPARLASSTQVPTAQNMTVF
jgi:hypothetical protein